MTTDDFLDRTYNLRSYNCLHFAVEVWRALTGEDLQEALGAMLSGQAVDRHVRARFKRLRAPSSPCIVIFQRRFVTPHIGIFFEGSVLHIRDTGPQYVPLSVAGSKFNNITFFQTCKT